MSTVTTQVTLGPHNDGQTMTLVEFADAQGRAGYRYELSRGVVVVTELPNRRHQRQVNAIRRQLSAWESEHPDEVDSISGGGESKMMIKAFETERHSDLSVYKTAPPTIEGRGLWSVWIPELVIEVVSPDSADRDYNQKPEEYLQFGVQEYWIVDDAKRCMTVHQRSDDEWVTSTISPGEIHMTPLLPEFEFDLRAVFDAIGA